MSILRASALCGLLLPACATYTATETYEFDTTSFTQANVSDSSGAIDVAAGETAQVEALLTWSRNNRPVVTAEVDGEVLEVSTLCRAPAGACWVDLLVGLPSATPLLVTNESGEIKVDGMNAALSIEQESGNTWITNHTGTLTLTTESGPVDLGVINGDITLNLGSGELRTWDLGSATTSIEGKSGNVSLDYQSRPTSVAVETDSGNIEVEVPAGAYVILTDTESGNIEVTGVTSDTAADATLDLSTESGNITVRGR